MLLRTEKFVSSFFSNKIFLRNHFCHSNLISKLELQKQKADLSFEIYRLILIKPDGLDVEKKSLHELIIQKIYQKSQSQDQDQNISHQPSDLSKKSSGEETFKYHEETRKPFIDLFEKGFQINPQIFSQSRIQTGKILSNRQQKFIFHPTYLITSQVFTQLQLLTDNQRIMAGHYGISKTVSVCLFWHLAKFIDEYRFQEGVTVSEDMMRVPKLVYWSIGTKKGNVQKNFKKIILDQCPEILKKLNLTDQTQYNWSDSQIKEFYSKNFSKTITNIIIDQFNFVAQLGRIYQKEIENVFENRRNGKYIKTQNISNENVRLFFELKEKIQFCIDQFHGVLGLSPTYLEEMFFEEQITYATQTNALIPITYWVQYSSKFYQRQSLAQIIDYFIFEMNQRIFKNLKNTKVSQETQKEMKKQCLDKLIERIDENKCFFFTPLDTVQQIRDITNVQSFDKSILQLKNEVKKIFQEFVGDSSTKYKNKLLEHIQQKCQQGDKEKKIKLVFEIYNYLINKLEKKTSQQNIGNKPSQQNIPEISEIPIRVIPFEPEEINKLLDKRLFKFEKNDIEIDLLVPARFMVNVIKLCGEEYFSMFSQFLLQKLQNNKINAMTGHYLESAFIKALIMGNVAFKFNLIKQKKDALVTKYDFDINDIYTFEQLQKRKKDSKTSVSILNRFKQTIKQMREKQKKYAVVFPVSKRYKQDQNKNNNKKFEIKDLANTSKMIDFVLIKNNRDSNLIQIWFINLTAKSGQIRPKIQTFIREFLEFEDNTVTQLTVQEKYRNIEADVKLDLEINYVVFGPKNYIDHNDFSKTLQKQFGEQITLNTMQKSNVFTVDKLANSEKCLLKRVAYIQLGSQFKFDQKNEQNTNNEYKDFLFKLFQII